MEHDELKFDKSKYEKVNAVLKSSIIIDLTDNHVTRWTFSCIIERS